MAGSNPNAMISDHALGASDCLSAFEVSIEIPIYQLKLHYKGFC